MKGVIIGSDLLEHNGDVKFIETNTNTNPSEPNAFERSNIPSLVAIYFLPNISTLTAAAKTATAP